MQQSNRPQDSEHGRAWNRLQVSQVIMGRQAEVVGGQLQQSAP